VMSVRQMSAAVGFKIPSGLGLTEGNPGGAVTSEQIFAGKKVVLFGVPGAFTPDCSKTHLPGYIEQAAAIKAKGVDEIVCITVNDAFVAGEWSLAHGAQDKVRVLADHQGALTKALGLELDLTGPFGLVGLRTKRFSAIVEDSVITALNVEPDSTGVTCSLSDGILKQL